MKFHLTFAFALLLAYSSSWAQVTFPVNGVHDERHTIHAFINADIYVSANQKLDSATLLIQDGKVIATGRGLKLPKGSVIHDCQGKIIYPSLIDAYCGMNVDPKAKKRKEASKTTIAANWNPAIHPEHQFEQAFPMNQKKVDDWLASGIGVANLHDRDGIMRGTSQLIFLGQQIPNEAILKTDAANHFSFSKGSSPDDYPSSMVGAIALFRQTQYDARWYSNTTGPKKEINPSLVAFNAGKDRLNIFELNSSLSARNVLEIGREFEVNYLMVGSGKEYMVLDELTEKAKFILPIHYPKPFDVSDPYQARMVSLAEMKHWESAPYNAYFLKEKGVPFCLTRDTISSAAEFISALKTTRQSGISHEELLAALTAKPAEFLGISANCGSLDAGKWANFIITDNRIGEDGFRVVEHWTKGDKVYESKPVFAKMVGTYNLVIEKIDYEVVIKEVTEKEIKATLKKKAENKELGVKIVRDADLIAVLIQTKDSVPALMYQLTGKITLNDGVWDGRGQNAQGEWVSWAAIKDRKSGAPKKSKLSETDSLVIPTLTHPNMAYGWDSLSSNKTFVITNAVVWTASDTGRLKRADVYVVDGKIKAIGTDMLLPSNVKRINASGKHLTPGLIDEHSHIALRGGVNEWAQASSAEVRMSDAVDPWNINIYRQLAGGVTTAQLLHGSANPIGGQSALIKLKWGQSAEEMLIDDAPKFIKFALGENVKRSNNHDPKGRFPLTRMGVEQSFADAFIRAKIYKTAPTPSSTKKGKKSTAETSESNERTDLELEAVKEILDGQRYITCHSYVQSEILMLMNLGDSLGFKVNTFTHILEGYKVSEEMKAHGANASTFSDWWAYKFEVNDAIPYNAALLTKAGINTAINSDDAEMGRRLNQEAAKSMKYGSLSEREALKLVTINPAKMLHLDHRIGSIEVGKDADLVIWSDNPLSVYALVEKTFIEGTAYFEASKTEAKQAAIQAERARLINKMLQDKSSAKKQPKGKKEEHKHCDTMLENYWEE